MNRSIRFAVLSGSFHPGRLWPRVFSLTLVTLLLLAPLQSAGAASFASHQAAALLADANWTFHTPQDWAAKPTTISATVDDADGLQTSTAAYRYSTNGGSNWSSWASDGALQVSSSVSTSARMTVTIGSLVDSATANQVQFRMTDATAAEVTSPAYTIKVDGSAPAAPANFQANPAGWTNQDSFSITWTNPTELSGVVKAYYKIGSAQPSSGADVTGSATGSNITSIPSISLGSHGHQIAYVWLEDAVGNSSYTQVSQADLWLDLQPPSSSQNLTAEPSTWTPVNAFAVSWTNPAQSDAPIQRAYYKLGSAPTSNANYSGYQDGLNIAQITGISVPSGGSVPCYIWLQDAAGNANYATATSVTLYYAGDSAPEPPINMQIAPSAWTSTNQFTATWTNPTEESGIHAAWFKWGDPPANNEDYDGRVAGAGINTLTGLVAPDEGSWDLHVWLEDGTGRRDYSRHSTRTAQYDITPPVTTYSFAPPLPAGGWFSDTVTVNLAATDALSGIKVTKSQQEGSPFWINGNSISASSHVTYSIKSEDNAGNEEEPHPVMVPIDKLAPTSSFSLAAPVPPSGWFTDTVTVNITATDNLSGWAASYFKVDDGDWQRGTQAAISGTGPHDLQYYSRDIAGNTESAKTRLDVCQIDQDPPTVTATISDTALYVQPPVTITLEAEDLDSGVEMIEYRREGTTTWSQGDTILIDESQGDGTYTYEYRARDMAGNVSAAKTVTVNVDSTPPATPTSLYAMPVGWAKVDDTFELHWTNPTDFSGIVGVYYQLDTDPALQVTTTEPIMGEDIQSLTELAADTEGEHDAYIWLVDGAGNHDPATRQVLEDAFKYDASVPAPVTCSVAGPLGEDGKHYTGTITVTLTATDTHSGLTGFHYQVAGESMVPAPVPGTPITATTSFHLLREDSRKELFYWAEDAAGNLTTKIGPVTLYFDSHAPASPSKLRVTPEQWSKTNSFALNWTNPSDYAGIGAAYYKMGAAPTANDDGQVRALSPGQAEIPGLTVEEEGVTPVFVWLKDKAGNIDYTTAVSVPLRYDITPPVTTLTATGTTRNGYYITPATIRLAAEDPGEAATAGIMQTAYRIDLNGVEGEWQTWNGTNIILDQDGNYTVHYYSVDLANNTEVSQNKPYKVDLHAPVANPPSLSDYASGSSTYVSWSANDGPYGSGIVRYTVQFRRGGCSSWQSWLTNIASDRTGETFSALWASNFHYFRVRAEDKAGHVSEWSPASGQAKSYIYREGLTNPRFDGSLNGWTIDPASALPVTLVYAPGRTGGNSHMVRIGDEMYDPYGDSVPANSYGAIYQTIQLPPADCDHGLILSFWTNMKSWDIAWSEARQNWWDTLDVRVSQADGTSSSLATRYGNFDLEGIDPNNPTLWESGWIRLSVDLTPWAGQRVRIAFQLHNRQHYTLPSWAFIDDVQLLPAPGRAIKLPLVLDPTCDIEPRVIPAGQSASPEESNNETGNVIPRR